MSALPGVEPSSVKRTPNLSSPADPIPESVLNRPIVGEARRFDGAVAPSGWLLMQGATLTVADYVLLFRVLGTCGGGDGKKTFKLPAPKQGWIIAASGTLPTTPSMLAQLGRQFTPQPAGPRLARVPSPRGLRIQEQRTAALREQQRFAASAPRPGAPRVVPVSAERYAQIDRAREDDRTSVLALLSAENRAHVLGLVNGVLAGSISMYAATQQAAASLSAQEARAALQVFDTTQRALGAPAGPGHADVQTEAGRFIVSVAFTKEQLTQFGTMQGNN